MHVLLGVGPGVIPGHAVPPNELEEVAGEQEVWLLCYLNVPAPNNQQNMDGWICNEGRRRGVGGILKLALFGFTLHVQAK